MGGRGQGGTHPHSPEGRDGYGSRHPARRRSEHRPAMDLGCQKTATCQDPAHPAAMPPRSWGREGGERTGEALQAGFWTAAPSVDAATVAAISLGPGSRPASNDLPGRRAGAGRRRCPPLFGLSPGGVCRAGPVTRTAVRSYRTLSPLPPPVARGRRFAFCGTFPDLAAGCRWQPPWPVEPGLSSPAGSRSGRPGLSCPGSS